jgi:small multidrug resistance family-3 protein
MSVLRAVGLFFAAGVAEIGGGYLMWRWLREQGGWPLGVAGALVLAGYGVIPTFQRATFGRAYAAYGGVFVVMSLLWGWVIDHNKPSGYEWAGAAIIAAGVGVLFFARG